MCYKSLKIGKKRADLKYSFTEQNNCQKIYFSVNTVNRKLFDLYKKKKKSDENICLIVQNCYKNCFFFIFFFC